MSETPSRLLKGTEEKRKNRTKTLEGNENIKGKLNKRKANKTKQIYLVWGRMSFMKTWKAKWVLGVGDLPVSTNNKQLQEEKVNRMLERIGRWYDSKGCYSYRRFRLKSHLGSLLYYLEKNWHFQPFSHIENSSNAPLKKAHLSHLKMNHRKETYRETSTFMILKYGVAFSPMLDFQFDNKLETSGRIFIPLGHNNNSGYSYFFIHFGKG